MGLTQLLKMSDYLFFQVSQGTGRLTPSFPTLSSGAAAGQQLQWHRI